MNEKDEVKKLYDALRKKGYQQKDIGDENTFRSKMSDKNSRKQLYDWVSSRGDFRIGDYDAYESRLAPAEPVTEAPVSAAPPAAQQERPKEQKPTPPTAEQQLSMDRFINDATSSVDKTMKDFRQAAADRKEYREKGGGFYGGASVDGGIAYNPQTRKMEKSYLGPNNRYFNKADADREGQSYIKRNTDMSVAGQLKNAYRKLAELKAARSERASQAHQEWAEDQEKNNAPLAAVLGAATYVPRMNADKEGNAYDVAIHEVEQQIQTLEDQMRREAGKDVGFWRGFGQVVSDVDTWDFGMGGMKRAMTMLNADQLQDPDATPGQQKAYQSMMEQLYANQDVQARYGKNAGFLNRAGKMTGYMPSFMLDFALTGGGFSSGVNLFGKGAAKTATRAIGKEAAEQIAKQGFKTFVKNNGAKGFAKAATDWTIKALGATADDMLLRAPLMANTIQGMKTGSDIIQRRLGDVKVGEDGSYSFAKDKTWGDAIWQGEANQIVENMSEMFGAHLPALSLSKGVGKLANTFGAKRIGQFLIGADAKAANSMMNTTQRLLSQMGISDYLGEVTEEYYGQLWRTMLNLDDAYQQNEDGSRTNLFNLPQFHGDIWGGMALSMGLMKAGQMSISAANYSAMKHGVNKADNRSRELFGPEVWDPMKARIDLVTNDEIGPFAESIANDTEMTPQEKEAVFNYMERSLNLRGFNLGTMAEATEQPETKQQEVQQEANESYLDGYSIATPEEMSDAKAMYDYQRQLLSEKWDDESIAMFENDPIENITFLSEGSPEEVQPVIDFINAKQVYEGMMQRVRDDIDSRVDQSNAMIDARVNHESGNIEPATMKQDDRKVYIMSGTAVPFSDGSGIDATESSSSIVIRDAETGKIEMVSPESILSIDEPLNAEQEKESAAQAIREQFSQQAADQIDGVVSFEPGYSFSMAPQEEGAPAVEVQITPNEEGIVDNGDGTVNVTDGNTIFPVSKDVIQQQADQQHAERIAAFEQQRLLENAMADEQEKQQTAEVYAQDDTLILNDESGVPVRGGIISGANEDGMFEVFTEGPINGKRVNLFSPEQLNSMIVEHNGKVIDHDDDVVVVPESELESEVNEEPKVSALESIPVNEKGEPMYEQAEPDKAWDAIVEQTNGDEEMAKTVAESMVKDMEAQLKKVEKAKPKAGATISEKIASEKEHKAAVEVAKQTLAAWQSIAQTSQRRKQAQLDEQKRIAAEAAAQRKAEEEAMKAQLEEQQRIEREALNGVPDIVDDVPSDARARGYRRVNGHKIDRQVDIPSLPGKTVSVKFANDRNAPGHVAVIEAEHLQPSHINGQHNAMHFIDEAQPKDRTDSASMLSATKIAENIRPEEITSSVTAFTGAPSVNTRGEVIQGNNRSDALRQLMSGIYPQQAEQYRQYLIDHADEFGVDAEAISNMKAPVLVNMLDADDKEAIELGQYVAQDTESGGIERIKPKNALQKMSSDVGSFASILLDSADEDMSFSALVDRNGTDVLKWMAQKNYITPTQYSSAFDSKGALTAEAKNDLRGIMYQSIFQGAAPQLEDMFNLMPAKAQKAILSTAYRDFDSPVAERMNAEIQNSVRAFYHLMQFPQFAEAKNYKDARLAVESWRGQYLLDDSTGESYLPADKFSSFALQLATMYKGESQSFIQDTFNHIYDLVQGTQAADLFEQPDNTPRSLAQAIKETFETLNIKDYGQPISSVLAGDSSAGQEGQQGSTEPSGTGERGAEDTGTADNTGTAPAEGRPSEVAQAIAEAEAETDTAPTEGQKAAGNYKKGHVKVDGYDISIENPKGSQRSGTDEKGRSWSVTMNNTYGYIKGTEGVDGDHIDIFLSDNPETGNVFVVDQVKADGTFDEHKVMYGFNSAEEAKAAYLANYSPGWTGLGNITEVSKEDFKKWIASSHRKTKPFADYSKFRDERSLYQRTYDKTYNLLHEVIDEAGKIPNLKSLKSATKEYDKRIKALQDGAAMQVSSDEELATVDKMVEQLKGERDAYRAVVAEVEQKLAETQAQTDAEEKAKAEQEQKEKEAIDKFRKRLGIKEGDRVVATDHRGNKAPGVVVKFVNDHIFTVKSDETGYEFMYDTKSPYYSSIQLEEKVEEKTEAKADTAETPAPAEDSRLNKGYSVEKRHHKKKDTDIYAVKFEEQMPREEFVVLKKQVKDYGGYYSSFGKGGFIFDNEADAHRFAQAIVAEKEQPISMTEISAVNNGEIAFTTPKEEQTKKDGPIWQYTVSVNRETGHTVVGREDISGPIPIGDGRHKFIASSPEEMLEILENNNMTEVLEEVKGELNNAIFHRWYRAEYQKSKEEAKAPAQAEEGPKQVSVEGLFNDLYTKGEARFKDNIVPEEKAAPKQQAPANPSGNRLVTDERYAQLKARMLEKLKGGQLNIGIDPEILAIGTEMAVYHLEKGARKFADYAKNMIADLGDVIRPYLKSFYNGARELPEVEQSGIAAEMTGYDEVRAFDVANFDKQIPNPIATAQTIAREAEVQEEVVVAKKKIKKAAQKVEVSDDLFSPLNAEAEETEPAAQTETAAAETAEDDHHGYKVGDKVWYITDHGAGRRIKATIADFDRSGGNVILDTGFAPVMYEGVDYNQIEPIDQDMDAIMTGVLGKQWTGLDGDTQKEILDKGQAKEDLTPEQKENNRKFALAVKSDMLAALETGQKPYRSIADARKRAKAVGMEVDNDGRTDILLQELIEDGLVRAAREVVAKEGSTSQNSFDLICKLYDMQPTIAARSSNRIKMQQYSTPLPMAWVADRFAMAGKEDAKVLEPTAGNGMLVFAVPSQQVHVNELDPTRLGNLKEQDFKKVTQQDATQPFEGGQQYDVIITNPPFGQSEAVNYDGKHISGLDPQITLNALESMKDDGKASIIIGGNMEYAANGSIKNQKPFFTYLYDHYNVKGVIDMDGKLFAKQGTTFPTRMILIDGRRTAEERAQSAVYPPVKDKAISKVETFEDLYIAINEVLKSKEKTNGTEILHSRQTELVPVDDQPSGRTSGRGHHQQPVSNDGTGSAVPSESTEAKSERTLQTGSRLLSREHREDSGNDLSRGGTTRSGSGRTGRSAEPDIQRVDAVPVSENRVGLTKTTTTPSQKEKRTLTEEKLPYISHNSAFSLNSVAPAAMVEAMDNVLSKIEKEHGSIDEFVRDELGYDTIEEAHHALAAEQMDSVAMAIYQMKQGQALIIGDQTGVGKGRQMAALIRWAVRRGEKPIFFTKTADLFSDIYRDLVDVGSGDLTPFIFNSDGAMVDSNGNTVHKPLSKKEMDKVLAGNELPEGYDFVILTYTQVGTGDDISRQEMEEAAKKNGRRGVKKTKNTKPTPKATFLRAIAKDNYMFLDESHSAAGMSISGAYLQSILKLSKAATFASATFAKRPDTMPLYAIRTAMSQAKVETDKMIGIIEKGGVTLQEIMSRELTNAGQMVRRERDMSDVVTDWKTITDEETVKKARENYDRTIFAFNAIIQFQEDFVKPRIAELDQELAAMAETAGVKRGTDKMGVENTPFASKTYNYTKQLMLALKVDAIVDEVDKEIKAGRHPVIAVESTMESSIKEYKAGDIIEEPTFSASLLKGLQSVMQYTVKDGDGKDTHRSYTPEQLGEAGAKAYYELQDIIRENTKGIFISPLDAITQKLNEKGYKVGELTGRNFVINTNEEGQTVVQRRTDKDKKRMQRDFNNGTLDVLILNKSAATGISLHASEKFSDQRQRTMIIAQPLSDINDYMQMIGRIDRTGQVHRGYYINLGLPVPAESRFLMMLSTKLKSLNANTTTSQDSESNEVDAPDLLNKYGSQVVIEYLRDNPEVYDKMGAPLKKSGGGELKASELDDYKPQEDDARRVTGYVALLSTKEQEDFYDDVVRRYKELIQYLNDTGNNDLKITIMPLRATTLEKRVSSEGIDPDGSNPFAKNSYVEKVEMDVLRKPMKADDVRKTIEQLNKGEDPQEHINKIRDIVLAEDQARMQAEEDRFIKAKTRAAEDIAKQTDKINRQEKRTAEDKRATIAKITEETYERVQSKHDENLRRLDNNRRVLMRRLGKFTVGESYMVPDNLETQMFDFSAHAIFCGFKVKESRITASTTLAVFATLDGRRKVEVKLSQFEALNSIEKATNDNWDAAHSTSLDNWDDQIPSETRKTGFIMTGNILQAIADTQDEYGGYPGQLISYTDSEGNIHDGILMPDKWNSSMLKTSGAPIMSRLTQVKNYEPVISQDGKVSLFGSKWDEKYYLSVPKSKKDGAIYYENATLLKAAEGHIFYPYRGQFRADIPADKITAVVNELSKLGVKVKEEQQDDIMYREATEEETIVQDAIENGTYMLAPNGQKSNLSPKQWAQVRTSAFKEWFGDWENDPENASKIVDENGEPMEVYHGTVYAGFNSFKKGTFDGMWFTTSRKDADSYAGNVNSKTYDPNEREEEIEITAGDYTITDYMTFDTEADREAFLKETPDAGLYLPEKLLIDMEEDAETDEEIDALMKQTVASGEATIAYMSYEDNHLYPTTFGDILHNYEDYTVNDMKRAALAYDSNILFDNLEDATSLEDMKARMLDMLEAMNQDAIEEAGESLDDMPVMARARRNSTTKVTMPINSRTYATFVNLRNPVIMDGHMRPIQRTGFYSIWENVSNNDQYDGAFFQNTKVGRYQLDGDVIIAKNANQIKSATDNNGDFSAESDDIRYRIREGAAPKKTGTGYKVFVLKDGKLFPPMVANPNGEETPVKVWLDADAAPVAGNSKTGRKQVKAGGKGTQGGSGKLAYRPGWHLGEIPYAIQFNRIDDRGEKTLFPANFVWAEVEYADDVDYQEKAMSYGKNANGNFQHSLAGLPEVPVNGSYRYRTNPNPATDPWIITGAMKVNRLLTPSEVDQMVIDAGRKPQKRQKGAVTDEQVNAMNDRFEREAANPAVFRKKMAEHAEAIAKKLKLDNVDIVTDTKGLEGRQAKAKGFYSKKAGRITIVVPNHRSMADIERTVLHEAVAHYGLRQLFGENFDTFLDNVFNNVEEGIRGRIVNLAAKNGWDFRKATEEYLASLAETTNFEQAKKEGWWKKVKKFFSDMLRSLGFEHFTGYSLSDNELRYVLWRSYENLKTGGKNDNLFAQAADVAKQYELGVGEYTATPAADDLLMRDVEDYERTLARGRYEERVNRGMYQMREALQDSMLGLKEAMKAILHGGSNFKIEEVEGYENAYLGENRLSSVNKAEADAFAHTLFKPMLDEVARLARTKEERQELTDYLMAKHGLERNIVMANRDAEAQAEEDKSKSLEKLVEECRERDYAGLTALTGMEDTAEAEAQAQFMVEDYEETHETEELWKRINAVSSAILSKSYECGMMNKETFEKVSAMYQNYIPLRGFDEKTSAEAYAYLTHSQSAFNAPIKKAEGRTSKADDPFANLQSMAESAIMQGNRNKLVKQRFLNFALNHPSDLVSISDIWLHYDEVSKEWKPVFPDNIESGDSADEVERKMQEFEQRMNELAEEEPDKYKHGRETVNIPYRVVESSDLRQHQVVVKRGGRDYILTINGNPRAAQALNGQTNPDNDMTGAIGAVLRAGESINRQLSAFYTTRNPDFIVSNFFRDMLYSNSVVWFKEKPKYAMRFHRNFTAVNPAKMNVLLAKYRKGTLDMNNRTEYMFDQFMKNGGETGYANIRDIEKHKNDIRRELKKANGKLPIRKAFDLLGERFDELNRAIENCARFAAFKTSREMGRDMDRAIYDAKEISVNFNKKGSGAKFYEATGQSLEGNAAALLSGLGRSGFVFWNAAIQGTTNFGRQLKRHPYKTSAGIAAIFLLGAITAYMGGDDDDDDKNAYYNLPEHVRRSNILFSIGEHWISIPLPVEYRAVYGMGELMTSVLSGKEHLSGPEIAEAIAGQASQILPIDFLEGGGGVNAFVPSAVKPTWEAYVAEKSWTGMPIYKNSPFNKNMPEWTKAYKSANRYIVGLAEVMNEATGGDRYTKGSIDFNPAKVEYMLNGYFGGLFGTIDKMAKSVETIAGAREYDPRSFLILNRLVKAGDERTEYRAVNKEYFRLKKEYEILKGRLRGYEKDTDNDIFDYAKKIDFIYNSPEYERYEIFEDYKRDIDDLNEELKYYTETSSNPEDIEEIEYELNELKKEMISEMNKTRKHGK